MRILAWPGLRSKAQMVSGIYRAAIEREDMRISVAEYRIGELNPDEVDVFHVNWPERLARSKRPHVALGRALRFAVDLARLRRRGVPIVWTVHNLKAHENRNPRVGRFVRACVLFFASGLVHLSRAGHRELARAEGRSRKLPSRVIPHPATQAPVFAEERTRARKDLGVAQDERLLLLLGNLRPYKGASELVEAFETLADPHLRLLIAGRAKTSKLRTRFAALAKPPRIQVETEWLETERYRRILAASDLVVLPYRDFLNSGVMIDALSAGIPVLAPHSAVTQELDEQHPGWLRMVPDPADPQSLAEALEWLDQAAPKRKLARIRSIEQCSRELVDFFCELRG